MALLQNKLTLPTTLSIAIAGAIIGVGFASVAVIRERAERALLEEVRLNLLRYARAASLFVDGDQHRQWKPGDEDTPAYLQAVSPLRKMMRASQEIDDIYTCILRDGKVHFVLAAFEPGDADGDGVEDRAGIMETYDAPTPEMLQALRQGVAIVESRTYRDKWGEWISGYAPIYDSSGNTVGIVGVDLSAANYRSNLQVLQHTARLAYVFIAAVGALVGVTALFLLGRLQRDKQQLRLLARALETAANGIAITDRSGIIQWVNPSFTAMTGYTRAEAIGQNPRILRSGRHSEAFYAELWQTILSGHVWKGRLVNRRKDGNLYTEEMTIAPVLDARGNITHFIAVKNDVTEQEQFEQSLERMNRQLSEALQIAEAASRAKSEFLANMSHEIRTPMNGIIGMAQLLADTPLNEEQREYVTVLKQSAESLLSLLGDILDLSKIEAGKLQLQYACFNPRELLQAVVHLFMAQARERGLYMQIDVSEEIPLNLYGDELRLRQILTNFVGNAVKFTIHGGVSIRIETAIPDAEPDISALRQQLGVPDTYPVLWVCLSVSDTGIGVPADRQQAIFESFTQADGSTTRRHGGTGLGLAINRKLVGLMGGHIGVHSEEGKGSTFWVLVPLFVPNVEQSAGGQCEVTFHQQQAAVHLPPAALEGPRRALLVEDNEVNRRVAIRLLQKLGWQVDVATDGVEAVEKTSRCRYDLVLMDIHMPRMDGLEATRRIRQREQSEGGHQVIIAMTASATKEDVKQCHAAGMDDYLSKPVRLEVLHKMLEKWRDAASFSDSGELLPIDYAFLSDMTGGDKEFERELLGEFLRTIPALMKDVQNAIMKGDCALLSHAAHTIKGSAKAIGARPLAEVVFRIELAGKSQRIEEAESVLPILLREWERLHEYISADLISEAA